MGGSGNRFILGASKCQILGVKYIKLPLGGGAEAQPTVGGTTQGR